MKKFLRDVIDFIKNHKLFIILFTLLNSFLLYYNFIYEKIDEHEHAKFLYPLLITQILGELALIAFYVFVKKKHFKIEKLFVAIALPLGLMHVFITPMNQLPDEIGHIFRAYAISEGKLVAEKDENGEIRETISKTYWQVLNNASGDRYYYRSLKNSFFATTSDEKWGWHYENTAGYHPVAYLPQVTGVTIGKTLNFPIVMTMYLGRIFALITFVVLIYFAIKNTPKYKEFFVFFALFPEMLQQGMAYSADGLLIGSSFLLISLALKYIYGNDKKLSKKQIASIYVLTALVSTCKKIIYSPIFLMFLLVPANKFKKKWHKYAHLFGTVVLAVAINLSWMLTQETSVSTDTENLSFVMQNPIRFLVMMVGTALGAKPGYYAESALGLNLAYGHYVPQVNIYLYIAIVFLVMLVLRNVEKYTEKRFEKVIYWAIPIIILSLIYFVSFTQWQYTKTNEVIIDGTQGRYFLPLLPLIPLLFHSKKAELVKKPISADYIFLFGIFINVCILTVKFLHNF